MSEKKEKRYYELPNPYANAPSCNINLLKLSRYAKSMKKKICDLTEDEIKLFIVQKDENKN